MNDKLNLKHLTNIFNPRLQDAKYYVGGLPGESLEQTWQRHLEYLKDKIIGRPKATNHYTVEELESFDMVGVYIKEIS